MIHIENGQTPDRAEFTPNPETATRIREIEAIITDSAERYLDSAPFYVEIEGLRVDGPDGLVPYGVNRLRRLLSDPTNDLAPELISCDLRFMHPIQDNPDSPFTFQYNWSHDVSNTFHGRPGSHSLLASENRATGKTLHSAILSPADTNSFLGSLELPDGIFSDSIVPLIQSTDQAHSLHLERRASTVIDPLSSFEINHTSDLRLVDGERCLTQELLLHIDHFKENMDINLPPGELYFPPSRKHRTTLRFDRTPDEDGWKFAGAYSGALKPDELIGEFTHNPNLIIPGNKILQKALSALSTPPER